MQQVQHEVLVFDRFSLDLTRGCLRAGREELFLSPKAFHTLRHLVENAGRLVSKGELHDAVWGKISVSDNSIVQCIRELRQKLGDEQRSLIKTVPRRGYLLDALPERSEPASPVEASAEFATTATPQGREAAQSWVIRYRYWLGAGLLVLSFAIAMAAAVFPGSLKGQLAAFATSLKAENNLFSKEDGERLALVGIRKQLPIPSFQIPEPSSSVPEQARRFIGVWVSDTGWVNSDRQFMMIVTRVGKDGVVEGYLVNGPSTPQSHTQSPAFSGRFTGSILNGVLRYDGNAGMHLASLKSDDRIEFKLMFGDGHLSVVSLVPFWTLPVHRLETAATDANK